MTRRRVGRPSAPEPGLPAEWRYGRLVMCVVSLSLTVGAVVVAVGLLPYPGDPDRAMAGALFQVPELGVAVPAELPPVRGTEGPAGSPAAQNALTQNPSTQNPLTQDPPTQELATVDPTTAPRRSGQGRRVVYDMSDQRVWLVRSDGTVLDSYLVSGSRLDNVHAGRYEVYSKSLDAIGYTETSSMRHMVRFTYGENSSIGFHDIPVDPRGRRVQSVAELGTPLSDGCIRQHPRDAKRLWAFAPVGTRVVVLD